MGTKRLFQPKEVHKTKSQKKPNRGDYLNNSIYYNHYQNVYLKQTLGIMFFKNIKIQKKLPRNTTKIPKLIAK